MAKAADRGAITRLVRIRLPALFIAAAVAAALVAFPQPAHAGHVSSHVSCWGDWCSGQDPQATGCAADAYTVAHARIPGTWSYVELRWSPTCKTNWARVHSSWGTSYPWALRAVQRDTGYQQVGVVNSSGSYSWTRQIYSPRLCVYGAWTGPPGTTATSCS